MKTKKFEWIVFNETGIKFCSDSPKLTREKVIELTDFLNGKNLYKKLFHISGVIIALLLTFIYMMICK